jgi:twitching motility protein PilT
VAAIDSLLRLLQSQNADALSLASGEVPRLTRAGEAMPLSMPPMGAALVETFVAELLTPEAREAARAGQEAIVEHDAFAITVAARGSGWSLSAKKRSARARASAPAPGPPRTQPASEPLEARPAPPASAPPAPAPSALEPDDEGPRRELERWLRQVNDLDASDLILSSLRTGRAAPSSATRSPYRSAGSHGSSPPAWMRSGGRLLPLAGEHLDESAIVALFLSRASEPQRAAFEAHGATDLAFTCQVGGELLRYRVNLFRHQGGVAASVRPIRRGAPSLEALRLPASLHRLIDFPHGLVLVTGPTGSGKSTTLSALLEKLNRTAERHVVTIEDPIEHEFVSERCLIHQREVGTHVDSFEAGLRSALREAPDLILLGEMRDRATIMAALTAAETGHLVLSTLHAGHAAMAVERIVDVFPEHQQLQVRMQLAQVLRAVLTQYLLPSAAGAEAGRVPVVELMVTTAGIASMIREGKSHQIASAIQTGRDEGMIPLDRSLAERVQSGELALETALTVTVDGGLQLRELLRARR